MRSTLIFALVLSAYPQIASATEYQFCISSNVRPGHLLIKSGPADFGKEWYKVKAAQAFCSVTGANGCSATDYDPDKCGNLPAETLDYVSIDGDQIKALFSGNPLIMGQTAIEVVVGVPVKAAIDTANGAAKAANKVCRWFAPHC